MKEFQNLNQEEQVDLRIVEHLDMQNLPKSIQNMLSLAITRSGEIIYHVLIVLRCKSTVFF